MRPILKINNEENMFRIQLSMTKQDTELIIGKQMFLSCLYSSLSFENGNNNLYAVKNYLQLLLHKYCSKPHNLFSIN